MNRQRTTAALVGLCLGLIATVSAEENLRVLPETISSSDRA